MSDLSNKIDGCGSQAMTASATRITTVERAKRESAQAETAAPARDSVSLTRGAQQLQQLEAAVRELPVADVSRVAAVRARLLNGTYQINPQVIADKLVRSEWEIGKT